MSKLGDAAMNSLAVGSASVLSSVKADGTGSEIQLNKEDAAGALANGVTAKGLTVSANAMNGGGGPEEEDEEEDDGCSGNSTNDSNGTNGTNCSNHTNSSRATTTSTTSVAAGGGSGGRRLAIGLSVCTTIGVQQTDWLKSNPYHWANSSLGVNKWVVKDHTVKVIEVKACGNLQSFNAAQEPTIINLPLNSKPAAPWGFKMMPGCAIWDDTLQAWTDDQMSVPQPENSNTEVNCSALRGFGPYVGLWLPVALPPTTTITATTTSVTSTTTTTAPWNTTTGPSTTTTTSTTMTTTSVPWWTWNNTKPKPNLTVASCLEALRPELPFGAGEWQCFGNLGFGRTCRVLCDAQDVTGLEGEIFCDSDLAWRTISACPIIRSVYGAIPTQPPSSGNVTMVIAFSAIFLILAMGAGVGVYCWCTRPDSSEVSEIKISPRAQDPDALEAQTPTGGSKEMLALECDQQFLDWAKGWANRGPTAVAQAPPPLPTLGYTGDEAWGVPGAPDEAGSDIESPSQSPSKKGSKDQPPPPEPPQAIQVDADPRFWEWAREWQVLRSSTTAPDPIGELPPPPPLPPQLQHPPGNSQALSLPSQLGSRATSQRIPSGPPSQRSSRSQLRALADSGQPQLSGRGGMSSTSQLALPQAPSAPTSPSGSNAIALAALPKGWTEKVSRSTGKVYYWHKESGKTQFERPK
eukprot:TRINITY_DN2214_c0_g1_i2.p1 TRINITY_DN2214_c0_g1~~TRINITY_DN2214_c0_g1_i2.p1  ORF type:complete len:767 (-),score=168.65 TRINITY_DN2214_c0_g1_i2:111-2180(-)